MSDYVQANTNGRLHDASEPSLSPLNRGFLYGDAVYEVWRTYAGRIFGWEEHWERLRRSAAALVLALPAEPEEVLKEIRRTVAAYRQTTGYREDVYIRLQVFRGEGAIGLDPALADRSGFILLVKPVPRIDPPAWEKGLTLSVAQQLRRTDPGSLDPAWKTGNYLNNLLCLNEARRRGADDVLILNRHGQLTEASTANIAFVQADRLITPPLSVGILAGVTRRLILEHVARRAGTETQEAPLTLADLGAMEECMVLSSTKDVQPVGRIDDVIFRVGEGTRARLLKQAFADYVAEVLRDRADLAV